MRTICGIEKGIIRYQKLRLLSEKSNKNANPKTLTKTAFCLNLAFAYHHLQPSACMSHLNGNAASATSGYFHNHTQHHGPLHHGPLHQHSMQQHSMMAGSPLPPPTYDTATTAGSKLADFRRTQSARFNGQVDQLLHHAYHALPAY